MLVRLIQAKWAADNADKPKIIEGDYTWEQVLEYNALGFNCYTWPNYPSEEVYEALPIVPQTGRKPFIRGKDCNVREWVWADMDLKDKVYKDKDEFVTLLLNQACLPTKIIDSGNGIHAYWKCQDLDDKSFLRLNRRISTLLNTDPAVSTLNQLMRLPGTLNVKDPNNFIACQVLFESSDNIYDAETLDKWLPPITADDDEYCTQHYNQCYGVGTADVRLPDKLPPRFEALLNSRKDISDLYLGHQQDRSTADFILGAKLFREGFSRDEMLAVLCRTAKAIERTTGHRVNYAMNIINKVWEEEKAEDKKSVDKKKLPVRTVADVLARREQEGTRIYCHEMLDATERGFRRGQVLGLIGGQGNGKTTVALNMLRWFAEKNVNSDYIHLYVSLEQPEREIVARWQKMSAELKRLRSDVEWDQLVYTLDNYNDDDTYRELGMDEIEAYVKDLQITTGKKVGCVVIDHIGVLKQNKRSADEQDGLIGVCKRLKSFANATDTFFIIQSQTSRAKNFGGDVELDIDAAFGTSNFESFVDFVMTTWQPLKRVYARMEKKKALFTMAFKFAKIRHKNALLDKIQADEPYGMVYDVKTELLREMTTDEHKTYEHWNSIANKIRNKDKKREPSQLAQITWTARSMSQERITPK